ncbi:hypothetical protein HG536_0G03540 [Torulaspora globosa]|uniref:GTP-binding protein n=1 Tax=Torulaspora globosa TaxID=48254 RepID=A0A7G3ZLV6_9SACH|nr:uncharacterized protein HG536_0G03540 [Torulaspora globosa]QLL34492.1 hypothetical protein HG536_0G03540 [Torulaspora globosa]
MEYKRGSSTATPPASSFQRKIAVLGARNVGKTTLTVRFVESHFVESYYPTIENEFTKIIQFKNHNYTLEILDTAGQDEFSLLNMQSLMGVKGIVLCYSVANRSSFEMVPVIWEKLVDQLGRDNLPVIVVANKIDIRDGDRSNSKRYVSRLEGEQMASGIASSDRKLQAGFIESSAKEDINVDAAIMLLLKKMEIAESGGSFDGSSDAKGCRVM